MDKFEQLISDQDLEKIWTEDFERALTGLINPHNAREWIETCETCRITITNDDGLNWQDLPEHEIVALAQTLARSIRRYCVLH